MVAGGTVDCSFKSFRWKFFRSPDISRCHLKKNKKTFSLVIDSCFEGDYKRRLCDRCFLTCAKDFRNIRDKPVFVVIICSCIFFL